MIAIPNMEKPKTCGECKFFRESWLNGSVAWCVLAEKHITLVGEVEDFCPLIEIVECKDCKYWADDMSGNMWCEHAIGGLTEATDFCSYGERRADEL